MKRQFTAFSGHSCIARGAITEVVSIAKERIDAGETARIAIFDHEAHVIDIDFRGELADVLSRLPNHAIVGATAEPTRKGPGRPRLGVVSREVSLLPRHWTWLAEQRGGASAALRRLVDAARRDASGESRYRAAAEAVHRFMWDIAGDLPGFEEASRALWAKNRDALNVQIRDWPADIREHIARLLAH